MEAALDRARRGDRDGGIQAIASQTADAPPATRSEAARTLAEIADLAEAEGDYAGAERALASAVDARNDFADLHCRRARLLVGLDRRRDARRALDRALEIHPQFLEARLERALLEAREGRVGEALESLRRISREVAVGEPQTFQQGMRSLERADWEEAASLLRRGLAVEDRELAQGILEARDALERGDGAGAAERARRLLDRHPAYPDLHALLGAAELLRGHLDDATSSLARALELNPDFHDARALFARALEAQGAIGAAAEQAAHVLEHLPDHAGALELQERWTRRPSAKARSRFTTP